MKKLVLTGGPCAGKSTALSYITQKLGDRGFYPLVVHEAPTLLMSGGISPHVYDERVFQKGIMRLMRDLENTVEEVALSRHDLNPVIVCDRGLPDCPPYFKDPLAYGEILKELELPDAIGVRDGRYGSVYHMRSAAAGAEGHYTNANNAHRRETLEEARLLDEETLAAWVGHPHLRVIDNSTDFAGKLRRLDQAIMGYLGMPVPLEIERKYECLEVRDGDIPVPHQSVDIEQMYLYSPAGEQVRVRRRGQRGSFVYFRTHKHTVRPGVREEREEFISAQEYEWSRRICVCTLQKTRTCFVWEQQYFELDRIATPNGLLHLLEIELTEEHETPKLPPFIKILREVTGDPAFDNYTLAHAA